MGDYSGFSEINAFVYHSVRNVFYDGVIWCLAPLIDESRTYGGTRLLLAAVTCTVCRRVLRVED